MEGHLTTESRLKGNNRNGRGKKTIKIGISSFEIQTPEDRYSSFKTEIIKKRQTILTDNL
ncbi:MAG: transposase [Flavobacteriaceae bacterium]|nr:transposase [Flavobacteriaceae bacterium]